MKRGKHRLPTMVRSPGCYGNGDASAFRNGKGILQESIDAGNKRREEHARYMLREVLVDPEYHEEILKRSYDKRR